MRPVLANASCEEIFEKGGIENGMYTIQPSLDLDPFPVECEFGEDGHVKTILNHKQSRIQYFFHFLKFFNSMYKKYNTICLSSCQSNPSGYTSTPNEYDGCADPGCFEDKISYEAGKEQIEVTW